MGRFTRAWEKTSREGYEKGLNAVSGLKYVDEGVKGMMKERLEMVHRVLDAFIGRVAGLLEGSVGRRKGGKIGRTMSPGVGMW